MRQAIIEALQAHAKGHIEKHKANIEVLLEKTAGIAGCGSVAILLIKAFFGGDDSI